MPWCPKCKNEYKDGYTVCADCGSDLVDELTQEEYKSIKISNDLLEIPNDETLKNKTKIMKKQQMKQIPTRNKK